MEAEVTRTSILYFQVCVPTTWTDEEILAFGEEHNPCGTIAGWHICKEGGFYLQGRPARVPCEEKLGFVHILLGA